MPIQAENLCIVPGQREPGLRKGKRTMNKKALIGLGLTAALAGAVATPAIVTAPTVAYAEDFTTVTTVDDLRAAVQKGGNIKLGASITASITIPANTTVTLDLGGFTLTNTAGQHTIINKGTLTVQGTGTVDNVSHARAALYNDEGGTATLSGGTFTRSKENGQSASNSGGNSYYTLLNHGTMYINAGTTVNQGADGNGRFSSLVENGYQSTSNFGDTDIQTKKGVLTINGGTFAGGLNTIKNDELGTMVINGGEFKNVAQAAVLNWNKATVTGGEFTSDKYGVLNGVDAQGKTANGTLEVTGGKFTAPTVLARMGGSTKFGSATVSGGTFDGGFAAEDIDGTTIGAGATFSDLSTLASAAKYLDKDLAVETSDGTTFTVATVAEAKDGAGCVVSPNLTTDNKVKVYFKGDKETAEALADSTFAMGDDGENKPAAEKLPVADVLVQNNYFDVDGTTSAAGSTTRGITEDEYSNNKLTVDLTNLPEAKKSGYVFAGWQAYTDSADADKLEPVSGESMTTSFDENDIKKADPQTDKATLYVNFFASWYNGHVTVKFNTDGGSKVDDLSLGVNADGEATLKASDLKTPTKAGYTFDGWAMEVMGEDGNVTLEKVTFPKTLGATLITKDNPTAIDVFTLKATWKKNAATPSEDKGDTGNNGNNGSNTNNGENGSNGENANTNTTNGEAASKNAGTTTTTTVKKAVQTSALPATGDNTVAAAAGIAAVGAAAVAAAAATKRRNNNA